MIDVPESSITAPRRRRRWVTPLIAAALAAVGVGVGVVLLNRGDDAAPAQVSRLQLADVDRACTRWMDGNTSWGPTSASWCLDMTAWMDQRLADRSMTGPMMWGDPERMRDTCRTWMSTVRDGRGDWCDGLVQGVGPMVGRWDEWMNGQMMGR